MKRERKMLVWMICAALFVAIFAVSCSTFGPQKAGTEPMSAMKGITYSVPKSAEIKKIAYYIGKFKGKDTIFFEITLKNISDQPKRFKVMVDIPGGPSSAYYYPRRGKPPVLKAGEEHMAPMPLVIYDKLPTTFLVAVTELGS